jgi:hypothetical protein
MFWSVNGHQKIPNDVLNYLSVSRLQALKSEYKALKTDHE